jgi:prolyl oligopeptidase
MTKLPLAALVSGLALALSVHADNAPMPASDDPYLWLEEVTGDQALGWVREKNAVTVAKMEADPDFAKLQADLLAILDSDARIPEVSKIGDHYYNLWRDKQNPRGLWRRTSLDEYRKPEPRWETVLDLDAIAKTEDENWVWAGANCLRPDYTRCLVALSRGGADANVTREFDLPSKQFVADGFVQWIDRDTVYVYTDFGDGSMTSSGYPRIVKQWKRGTPMSDATVVYEGTTDDMYIAASRDHTPGFERDFVSRTLAFYNDELYLRGSDGALTRIDAPNSANKSVFREWLALELREAWTVGGRTYAAGSLLASKFDDFMAGKRELDVLFEPSQTTSLASVAITRDHVIVNVLDDVKNRLSVLTPETRDGKTTWRREPLKGAPAFGSVGVRAVDSVGSNAFFMTSTDYVTPTTLFHGTVGAEPENLKSLPAFFDASKLAISQHFATSRDGTRVPYFQVAPKFLESTGKNPTLLYGYGGFEISQTPAYSAVVGRAWLEQGGVYVVANIRGGGEYGPRWHQAALKANRLRAYEDFAAVAQDLIDRKVTSPKHLGIRGGSNGGLLVGNMVVLYPELFNAAISAVPLLDMKRYHKLLAGASWMAEYGNPDDPAQWEFIQTYSPYQNVKPGVRYPTTLFTTSTRDDRVHPGHARKMMARMAEQGHDVLYYENIEGGHGGAANNQQSAFMNALQYTFLKQQLFAGE